MEEREGIWSGVRGTGSEVDWVVRRGYVEKVLCEQRLGGGEGVGHGLSGEKHPEHRGQLEQRPR